MNAICKQPEETAGGRDELVGRLTSLFEQHGSQAYADGPMGPVSLQQHALQCAQLGVWARAPEALVAAALLHDVGHLLALSGLVKQGIDTDDHAVLGGCWLARWLPPDITEPVRLHVAARRYLARVDRHYRHGLSPLAQHSLQLQGGAMTEFECAEFEARPHAAQALALRRWDDAARHPDMRTSPLPHFLAIVADLPLRDVGTRSHSPALSPTRHASDAAAS